MVRRSAAAGSKSSKGEAFSNQANNIMEAGQQAMLEELTEMLRKNPGNIATYLMMEKAPKRGLEDKSKDTKGCVPSSSNKVRLLSKDMCKQIVEECVPAHTGLLGGPPKERARLRPSIVRPSRGKSRIRAGSGRVGSIQPDPARLGSTRPESARAGPNPPESVGSGRS